LNTTSTRHLLNDPKQMTQILILCRLLQPDSHSVLLHHQSYLHLVNLFEADLKLQFRPFRLGTMRNTRVQQTGTITIPGISYRSQSWLKERKYIRCHPNPLAWALLALHLGPQSHREPEGAYEKDRMGERCCPRDKVPSSPLGPKHRSACWSCISKRCETWSRSSTLCHVIICTIGCAFASDLMLLELTRFPSLLACP